MFRFLLGVGFGAALVYFLDTERGAARRTQTSAWVRQYVNPDTIEQARQTTLSQARNLGQQISQQAGVVTDKMSQYRSSRRESAARETGAEAARSLDNATAGANI
jgi:hypothetical protein